MKVYSYLVARDWGFAPNPFFGYCTIAWCKPTIRRVAKEGDIIVGTGTLSQGRSGQAIFVMRVSEKLDFALYWQDRRFERKRPILGKSRMLSYGDNIYEPLGEGKWLQHPSHHSWPDLSENHFNKNKDTSSNHVLISEDYIYWGDKGPKIPAYLRDFDGIDLCAPTQGHISRKITPEMCEAVAQWFDTLQGGLKIRGRPSRWSDANTKP